MIKKVGCLIFFLCCYLCRAQQTEEVSIQMVDTNLEKAIDSIEKLTNYKFYFLREWLSKDTISLNYDRVQMSKVLEDLLNDSSINYYVLNENKIILTRNNRIYDSLPEGFFGRNTNRNKAIVEENSPTIKPIFISDTDVSNKRSKVETVYIGKETEQNRNETATLSGRAVNSSDGQPIPNLSIFSINTDKGTTTDDSGFYEIDLPLGENLLQTRSLGIATMRKRVILYSSGRLNFTLEESVEQLNEVIVEADADKNVEETLTGTNEIDSEESKNIPLVLGERNILKVATTLPAISTAGEGATGFNVRGGKTDQNLILLDDAVIYNPTHFFGIFQALNPFTTKNVTIYTGSIPAEYGGRLSSVFDIVTKDGNVEQFSGEGSIGPVTGNLALEIPIVKGKSALVLGGRGTYSDWLLQSLNDESLKNSQASFYDMVVKYNHKINGKNDVKINGYYSNDRFSITSDSLYGYSNRLFSLKWNRELNARNSGSLILTNSAYNFEIDYDGPSNGDFNFGYQIDELGAKLRMAYRYNNTHRFTYGIASKLYRVKPGKRMPTGSESSILPLEIDRERGLESAVFISDAYKINDRLTFDIGLRYSMYQSLGKASSRVYRPNEPRNEGTVVDTLNFEGGETIKTYHGLEPRVSARYYVAPDFSVKASYNRSYQYIHTLSNNTTVSPIDTWKLSDLNIEPQKADQYSLGFYKNLEENKYEISLEGYYKSLTNILDFKTGAQLLLNQNIETEVLQGTGKAYGIEFLLRKNKGKLNGWFSYAYARSFNKLNSEFPEETVNNGAFFPANYDKPHDVSLVANYRLTKRYSVSANVIYQTGRPVTYPLGSYRYQNADYVFYSDRNKFRIPDYYRLDLSFNMEGNHKIKKLAHSFWSLSIYNLLGRNNPYSVFFVTAEGDIKAYKSSIFSIPIPTITYNFKF